MGLKCLLERFYFSFDVFAVVVCCDVFAGVDVGGDADGGAEYDGGDDHDGDGVDDGNDGMMVQW